MKHQELDKEDELLRSLFQATAVKSKIDITEKVMQRIDETNELFVYTPIIGQKMWIWLGAGFSALILFLLTQSASWTFTAPGLLQKTGGFLEKMKNSFQLDWGIYSGSGLPELQSPYFVAMVSFIVIGVFLMISYQVNRQMFR